MLSWAGQCPETDEKAQHSGAVKPGTETILEASLDGERALPPSFTHQTQRVLPRPKRDWAGTLSWGPLLRTRDAAAVGTWPQELRKWQEKSLWPYFSVTSVTPPQTRKTAAPTPVPACPLSIILSPVLTSHLPWELLFLM